MSLTLSVFSPYTQPFFGGGEGGEASPEMISELVS